MENDKGVEIEIYRNKGGGWKERERERKREGRGRGHFLCTYFILPWGSMDILFNVRKVNFRVRIDTNHSMSKSGIVYHFLPFCPQSYWQEISEARESRDNFSSKRSSPLL